MKITQKQKLLLQDIAKSHPYFPELALDDLTFKNNLYVPNNLVISDLIEQEVIKRGKGKSLIIPSYIAKRYWDEIIKDIPIQENIPITYNFLNKKSEEDLYKAYKTLEGPEKNPSKEEMIKFILTNLNRKEEKMVKENKQGLTPKEFANDNNISPTVVRKLLRSLFGKTEGNWSIDEEMGEKILSEYERMKEKAKENRAKNIENLKKAREAKVQKSKK